MHHEIRYNVNDPKDRERAINDVREWIGDNAFAEVVAALRNGVFESKEHFVHLMNTLAGVSGYPIEAMWDKYTH